MFQLILLRFSLWLCIRKFYCVLAKIVVCQEISLCSGKDCCDPESMVVFSKILLCSEKDCCVLKKIVVFFKRLLCFGKEIELCFAPMGHRNEPQETGASLILVLRPGLCNQALGPNYIASFSPASGAEILLRLRDERQPGLKC